MAIIYNSKEVTVGNCVIGGNNPIVIQSMTNTNTNDIDATVNQCERLFNSGCEIVRITTQGLREVKSFSEIKKKLRSNGFNQPLVADVHFSSKVAEAAAYVADKVRINPGNYVGKASSKLQYTDKEYNLELEMISDKILPLIKVCEQNGTAIRVGVNHGSLSRRILERYGNTSTGMVQSASEFANMFYQYGFHNLIFSLKASNVNIMIEAYEKLVEVFNQKLFNYPLHLGVTEAGDGVDAIVKSSVGIGYLLDKKLGDTIRVSITGDPIDEIPIAKLIAERYNENASKRKIKIDKSVFNEEVICISKDAEVEKHKPYSVIVSNNDKPYLMNNNNEKVRQIIVPADCKSISYDDFHATNINENKNSIFKISSEISDINKLHVDLSIHLSNRLLNGLITDALWLHNNNFELETLSKLLNSILQATRKKNTQTEYIACPSCGRTLFNISEMLSEVKEATNHLTHLKIAVMGCIVNGPGEMNDADYGYIGAGPGVVSIYKKQNLVLNKVPQQIAVAKLVEVIKLNNDWVEKPIV